MIKPGKSYTFFILLFAFFACKNTSGVDAPNSITIGEYTFDFPAGFNLINGRGIDSYVGRIEGDELSFQFDFGYYSNTLVDTPEEFMRKHGWLKMHIAYPFLKEGVAYDNTNLPDVQIKAIHPVKNDITTDYIVKCTYRDSLFNIPVKLPDTIKNYQIETDTIDHYYVKIVYPENALSKMVGIYIQNLDEYNTSIRAYKTLTLSVECDFGDYKEVLDIFRTVRTRDNVYLFNR